jgi:hypothetical protein
MVSDVADGASSSPPEMLTRGWPGATYADLA